MNIIRRNDMARGFRVLVCGVLIALFCISFSIGITASASYGYDAPRIIQVTLHGAYLYFDVPPENFSGRVMVPMRVIFEAIGANIAWNANTRTITATRGSTVVQTTIGSRIIRVNGVARAIDTAPVILDGRTLVPVRFISEAFGYTVRWNGTSKIVAISGGIRPAINVPSQIVGTWQFLSGRYIYYFGHGNEIIFFADGTVYSYYHDALGSLIATGNGRFAVRWQYPYHSDWLAATYSYTLTSNRLTITDIDGDRAVYIKR